MSFSGTIAVVMGGPGSEHEVSLASGKAVAKALSAFELWTVKEVVVDKTMEVVLPVDTTLVANMIHGTFGEDGALQDVLEARGVPYTGAGADTSRLAFDKFASKERFREHGVSTPDSEIWLLDKKCTPDTPLPFVAKPPKEGSSVGVHLVREPDQIAVAREDLQQYGNEMLVEPLIDGAELTVGVFDNRALPVVHIKPRSGFYDMSNKYPWLNEGSEDSDEGSDYDCPAHISEALTIRVQEEALKAHQALGVEVYSRVDVLLDSDGTPFVLEVNTIPGMTETSLLPKAALAAGLEFGELCKRICEISYALRQGGKRN